MPRRPLLQLLPVVWITGVLVCRVLIYGRPALDGPTLAACVTVPAAQAAVLALAAAWSGRRSRAR